MRADGSAVILLRELFAQVAEAGAAIKHIEIAVDAHLDARGIAAVTEIFLLRCWRGASYSPESH